MTVSRSPVIGWVSLLAGLLTLAACDSTTPGVPPETLRGGPVTGALADEAIAAARRHVSSAAAGANAKRGRQFAADFDSPRAKVERRGDTLFVASEAGWAEALDVRVASMSVDRRAVYGVVNGQVVSVQIAEYVSDRPIRPHARLPLWEPKGGDFTLWYGADYTYQRATGASSNVSFKEPGPAAVNGRVGSHQGATMSSSGSRCVVEWTYDVDTREIISHRVLFCYSTGGPGCSPTTVTCGGGGGGGSGGLESPGTPDPCNVGDPALDGQKGSAFLSALWSSSSPGTESSRTRIEDRKEVGAWIVRGPDGSTDYVALGDGWVANECGMGAPDGWESSIPDGTIGYIHTHPYYVGENVKSVCGDGYSEDYSSGTGDVDIRFMLDVMAATDNISVKGYIIDGGGITVYGPFTTENTDPIPICGYSID